jgi:hypothetical protein
MSDQMNAQITDAVIQTNGKVVSEPLAHAIATLCQVMN